MASVRFNLRHNKKKDPQIYLIYRMDSDRKKLKIGTKIHVPEKYWNHKDMKVRETTKFMDHVEINSILLDWKNAVNEVNKRYLLQKKTPSMQRFKEDVIREMAGMNFVSDKPSFTKHFENYIELKKTGKASTGSVKQYQNALNKVNEFRKARLNGRNLEFDDLTESLFVKFINYLRDGQGLHDNTIHKIIKKARTVINHATAKGFNTLMEYKNPECQVSYIKQPKIYLSLEEIEMIRNADLEQYSRLDKVRDRFLIGIRTGLRYSDFSKLSIDHITREASGKKYIEIYTKKDKKLPRIPLAKEVEAILEKHDGYPPSISEVKFNLYLKEICKEAEIDTLVPRIEDSKQVMYKKHQLVSSHICRRSFATNGFLEGIHPKYLKAITGHTTIKQFMEYICIDEDQTVEALSDHGFMA